MQECKFVSSLCPTRSRSHLGNSRTGVVEFDENMTEISIEKPKDYAVRGLHFYENTMLEVGRRPWKNGR